MSKAPEAVAAEIAAIRRRVEEQYPAAGSESPLPVTDLLPLFHARDAAEGKVAAIGKVNPRPPGIVNAGIQVVKRALARGLNWLIRDQVDFNTAAVRGLTETLDALHGVNRSLVAAGRRLDALEAAIEDVRRETDNHLRNATDSLSDQIRSRAHEAAEALQGMTEELRDEQRAAVQSLSSVIGDAEMWIESVLENRLESRMAPIVQTLADQQRSIAERAVGRDREDIRLLRALADVQNAFMQRMAQLEAGLKDVAAQRAELAAQRTAMAAREELAAGLSRLESQIHSELRTLRQRVGAVLANHARNAAAGEPAAGERLEAAQAIAAPEAFFDSLRFADRFRGSEEQVREDLRVHLPAFAGQAPVLDLGCGRGEFLELLRDAGIEATGVEANPELVQMVVAKGLRAVEADLFAYLEAQSAGSVGGLFCAHVIEHLSTHQLARLIALGERVLRPGGVLVFETPNPRCLAIFATYFYLDPTHVRPVPSELLTYLLDEAGFQETAVTGLHPAEGDFHELKPLPEGFRQQFFGFMDYAVLARKR